MKKIKKELEINKTFDLTSVSGGNSNKLKKSHHEKENRDKRWDKLFKNN